MSEGEKTSAQQVSNWAGCVGGQGRNKRPLSEEGPGVGSTWYFSECRCVCICNMMMLK